MSNVSKFSARSGRMLREDGSVINAADVLDMVAKGQLKVQLDGDSIVIDNVDIGAEIGIKDGENKLKVNADGSIDTQLTGSIEEEGFLKIAGNTTVQLAQNVDVEADADHSFGIVQLTGVSSSITLLSESEADVDIIIKPKNAQGITEADVEYHKADGRLIFAEFNNKTRFYDISVRNRSANSIKVRYADLTQFNAKVSTSGDDNGGTDTPSVNIENQYITNQRLYVLKTFDNEFPYSVESREPCFIQSMVIRGNHNSRNVRFILRSLDSGMGRDTGSAIYSPKMTFKNLEEIGGEDA